MSKIDILKSEIDNDPEGVGYSTMSNKEVAVSLNAATKSKDRPLMPVHEILGFINWAEWTALTDRQKSGLWSLVHAGEVNPFSFAGRYMREIFGETSTTFTAFKNARREAASRANELGLGKIGEGDIWDARNKK